MTFHSTIFARLRHKAHCPCLLLLLLIPISVQAESRTTPDGVPVIRHGAQPELGIQTWRLEEMWRVGGLDDENIFGLILDARIGPAGRLYLLDGQLCQVAVFSPESERVGTLSRRGEGPGELQSPVEMVIMPDGRLGVAQHFPPTVSILEWDGTPAGVFRLPTGDPDDGNFVQLFNVEIAGDDLVAGFRRREGDQGSQRTQAVARFDGKGVQLAGYEEIKTFQNFMDPRRDEEADYVPQFDYWTALGDGRVVTAPHRNRYSLNFYRADGSLERIVERDFTPCERTTKEKDQQRRVMEARTSHVPGGAKLEVSRTEPDIARVCSGPDGNIWIETSRGRRPEQQGVMMVWDVFTPEGNFLKQIAMTAPHDPLEDILLLTAPDRLVVITQHYRVKREFMTHGLVGEQDAEAEAEPMTAIMYKVLAD